MVIAATTPGLEARPNGVNGATSHPHANGVAKSDPNCLRCGARMMMGYDEPECLVCGFSDYTFTSVRTRGNSVISAATRYILRYVGEFPTLTETLAHVRLKRLRNRVVYDVNCPFCDKTMDQSSLSGKRPEAREQRYKCSDGHRVSLIPRKNGMLGWR